jgi:F420-non-reducing hydrogenase large subunit
MVELADDPELTDQRVRELPSRTPREGIGAVEAPRGTLLHDYRTDEDGIVRRANFIVGTGNNYAAICLSIKRAAQGLISDGKVDDSVISRIESACRAYDPCLGCATHAETGEPRREVLVYDATGRLITTVCRG